MFCTEAHNKFMRDCALCLRAKVHISLHLQKGLADPFANMTILWLM